jgi:hypothetical protein
VIAALVNDLNPFIDAQRRLIARWSCSTMLLRYLQLRTSTYFHFGFSHRSNRNACVSAPPAAYQKKCGCLCVRYGVCFEGELKAADTRHRRLRCDDNYCEYIKAMIYASFENINAWRNHPNGAKTWHDIQAALSLAHVRSWGHRNAV